MKRFAWMCARVPSWVVLVAIVLLLTACPGDGAGNRSPY